MWYKIAGIVVVALMLLLAIVSILGSGPDDPQDDERRPR